MCVCVYVFVCVDKKSDPPLFRQNDAAFIASTSGSHHYGKLAVL